MMFLVHTVNKINLQSDLFFSIPLGFNGAQREMCATRRRDNQRNVTKYCCYFFV